MSWSDRRTLCLGLLALAGCGYAPVYGTGGGTGTQLQGRVLADEPNAVEEYLLVRALEDKLGRPDRADLRLAYGLETVLEGQAFTESNEITRYSIVGTLTYILFAPDGETVLIEGDVTNFTGYSATGSTAEQLASERDARERLMNILADQLTQRLYAMPDLAA
jgi:LPS-assembly lipoprotein